VQSHYPASFDREYGCSEAEWLHWLPDALGSPEADISRGTACVSIDGGRLELAWSALPPRRIALVQLPRLAVRFRFDGVTDERRFVFMRRFDLYLQRGGG
jgi:hypothetical protein